MLNKSLTEQYVLICITLSLWWPAFSLIAKDDGECSSFLQVSSYLTVQLTTA